jgi:hypothetical protein
METDRMTNALALADKCWGKAVRTSPDFVHRYLELAEELLASKQQVLGDEFREYCSKKLLFRPAELHPNVWVSGVRALQSIGWIVHNGYTMPTKSHNHMPSVSVWRSTIYGSYTGSQSQGEDQSDLEEA